jgi:hypothetical protein
MVKTVLFMIMAAQNLSFADTWKLPAGKEETKFNFGNLTCSVIRTVKTEIIDNIPDYTFQCYEDGKILFKKEGYGADVVEASKGGKFLVGISNNGLVRYDYWVIDKKGLTITESFRGSKFDPNKESRISYCKLSKTLQREWFDAKNPGIAFQVKRNNLIDVTVRTCKGRRISLLN